MVLQCSVVNRTCTVCRPGLQTVFKPHSLSYKPPYLPVYFGLKKDGLKTNEYVFSSTGEMKNNHNEGRNLLPQTSLLQIKNVISN